MKNYPFKKSILIIPVIVNTVIFILLSILHFYWTLGGKLWLDNVLPTSSNGLHQLKPGTTATLIVSFGLLFLAIITAGSRGWFDRYIKRIYFFYGNLIIGIIFFSRAIGDFRFVGFFKTVKWTRFAANDSRIFSPLCLFISLLSLLIFIFSVKRPDKQNKKHS